MRAVGLAMARGRGAKPLPYKARLEYLESTGTQYIKTGVLFNSIDLQFRLTMALDNSLTGGWVDEFVAAMDSDSADQTSFRIRRYDNGNFVDFSFMSRPRACPGTGYSVAIRNVGFRTLVLYSRVAAVYYEDGTLIRQYTGATSNSTPCGKEIYLFCGNNNNSPFRKSTGMKVKEYVVTKYGEEVQHLIPVLDNDSVPCMYDKVSGEFFYNQGTGSFTAGPVVGGGGISENA